MNHRICDECETVSHCRRHGCIPKVPACCDPSSEQPWAWIDGVYRWAEALGWVAAIGAFVLLAVLVF